jgi:vacuolar iron transporter family protein
MINNLLLKSLIYGGIDGVITIFNVISGIKGSNLNTNYIFIIGVALLFSDGLSMAVGDYLSIKAHIKNTKIHNEREKNKDITNIKPHNNALITFISFVLFGSIPLILYIIIYNNIKHYKFIKMYISTLIALFIIGSIQSKYTNEIWYKSGINTSIFGGITALLSYSISSYISKIFL